MNKVKKYYINLRLKLKMKYGWICLYCFSEKNLEFVHVRKNGFNGMGRGSYHRYLNINKNFKDYSLFCHNCHNKFHSNPLEKY